MWSVSHFTELKCYRVTELSQSSFVSEDGHQEMVKYVRFPTPEAEQKTSEL